MRRVIATAVAAAALAVTGGIVTPMLLAPPSKAQEVDLERILRCFAEDPAGQQACAEARELIIFNCTTCHSFVPIVMVQFDGSGWDGLFARHVQGDRTNQLSQEQVDKIKSYVTAQFNPDHDPPELPPELLRLWTDY